MSGIRTGVGLFSGIDIAGITQQLIDVQRAGAVRLESRIKSLSTVKAGVEALEANVLGLATSIGQLNSATLFNATAASNSDADQLSVGANSTATLGSYGFQVLKLASTERRLSTGFANSNTQKVGAGTITIARGGFVTTKTELSTFNGGAGVQRGSIRLTDRSGASTVLDLSQAASIDDVLSAINDQSTARVQATTVDGHLVLTDTSGGSSTNLSVQDIGGGKTAQDLGIRQSVGSATLTGSEVYYLTEDFALDHINDGNRLFSVSTAPDLRLSLADGTNLDVNLDEAANLKDVLSAINNHSSNSGKATASLSNGRLVLTDNTTGASSFAVSNLNGAAVVNALGLDNSVVGNVLTGDKLLSGLNSRLLRNLRGGQGISTLGQVALTDRAGRTATIDLSAATSLDDVVREINAAQDSGTDLALTARINSLGNGIEIEDSSGATTSNLVVADVGGGTVATDLGISVNAATNNVRSGSLGLRYINESTSLSDYAPDGTSVDTGSFLITDTAGNQASISITSSVKTVGDVLSRINSTSGIQVRAELNSTGDGFVIRDLAGGTGTLRVTAVTGNAATDLRIAGTGSVGSSGSAEISSRRVRTISVSATDTLQTLSTKINAESKEVSSSVIRIGSAFNPFRLSLASKTSGEAGRLIVDSGDLDLGLSVTETGTDAVLQVGTSVASSYLVKSGDNQFEDVAEGISVIARSVGTSVAHVEVSRNSNLAKDTLKSLTQAYNAFIDKSTQLSVFNADPAKNGPLQGQGVVLRVKQRLSAMLTRTYFGTSQDVRTLSDLGLRITTNGKLQFDEAVYDKVAESKPDAIRTFFTDTHNGAAKKLDATLDSLTDTVDGVFKSTKKSLEEGINSLQGRVDSIDALLVTRKDRLLKKFIAMESAIGQLQSQQNALTSLSALAAR